MRVSYVLNAVLAVPCVTALAVGRDAAPPGPPALPGPPGPPAGPPAGPVTRGPPPPPSPPPAAPAGPAAGANTVKLNAGSVKGFADASGNSVFLGIPFAETTGGQNRYV
jgi:hypothetical protein